MIGYLLIVAVLVTALLVGWLLDSRADDSLPRYGNGRNCDQCGRFCIPVALREVYGYRLVCDECKKKEVLREIAMKADTVQWLVARNALGDHYVDEVTLVETIRGALPTPHSAPLTGSFCIGRRAASGTADRCYGCEQYTAAADLVRVEIGANICADFCRDCAAHILRGRNWRQHGTV